MELLGDQYLPKIQLLRRYGCHKGKGQWECQAIQFYLKNPWLWIPINNIT